MSDKKTVFEKIISGELSADYIYEDDHCIVIKDMYPKAPIHYLVIPRKHIATVVDLEEEDKELISHMIFVAKDIAEREQCEGYRLQFNVGEKGGQVVFHLHLHLMGWK